MSDTLPYQQLKLHFYFQEDKVLIRILLALLLIISPSKILFDR